VRCNCNTSESVWPLACSSNLEVRQVRSFDSVLGWFNIEYEPGGWLRSSGMYCACHSCHLGMRCDWTFRRSQRVRYNRSELTQSLKTAVRAGFTRFWHARECLV
jgi:hypothetical protein